MNPKYKKVPRNTTTLGREVMIILKQRDKKSGKRITLESSATIKIRQEKDKGFDLEL